MTGKYDNANGGSDNSHDPNPSRDPNDYLVPRRDGGNFISLLVVIALYAIVFVLILKPTKFYIYE